MKTVIFDPVVPVEMLASASTDNCYQENDFTAPSSIDGNGEKNLLNTDAVSNNNIEEEHAMSEFVIFDKTSWCFSRVHFCTLKFQ